MQGGRGRLLGVLALVALIVVLVDGPVLGAQAVSFDDATFIQWNPIVGRPGLASIGRAFSEVAHPSTVRGYYIPLTMVSLMADFALGARYADLRIFHATNLALHVATTLLLLLVWRGLFRRLAPAALVALAFALHPLTVEPLAWVAERKTLLASFFVLASLAAYVEHARRPAGSRPLLGASLVAYLLALLSKPTAIPLPLLLLLLDAWPLRRLGARALWEKLPFLALAALSAVVTYRSHAASAGLTAQGEGRAGEVSLLVAHNLGFYLEKFLWPAQLTSVYVPPRSLSFLEGEVALRVALVVAALALAALLRRRSPAPAVGLAFFALSLGPTLGVVRFSWVSVSDKYAYLPIIGLLLPLAAYLARAWDESRGAATRRRAALYVGAIVLAVLAARTRSQLSLWRDSETLQRHMATLAPDSANVHSLLGNTLLENGSLAEAEAEHSRALALAPNHPYARLYLLRVIELRGDSERALAGYRELALGLPAFAEAHWFLGRLYARRGDAQAAVRELSLAVAQKPQLMPARLDLAQALLGANDRGAAVRALEASLEIFPDQPRAIALLRQLSGAPG